VLTAKSLYIYPPPRTGLWCSTRYTKTP
jgi:hypothetical protein